MNMNAYLLREAARLMRERAGVATPGPWETVDGDTRWEPTIRAVTPGSRRGWRRVGQLRHAEDAVHIASWHPAVALAVADCLDAAANHWPPDPHEPHEGCPDCSWLAVARAYLEAAS